MTWHQLQPLTYLASLQSPALVLGLGVTDCSMLTCSFFEYLHGAHFSGCQSLLSERCGFCKWLGLLKCVRLDGVAVLVHFGDSVALCATPNLMLKLPLTMR